MTPPVASRPVVPLPEGKLVENIVHFARALRKAGVRVGTSQVQAAVAAVAAAGFTRRADFHATLRATLITRAEHLEVFEQVFAMFWRDPEFLERMVRSMLPLLQTIEPEAHAPKAAQKRAAEALWDGRTGQKPPPEKDEIELDAHMSCTSNEVLRHQDFEQMSQSETRQAEALIRQMRLPADPIRTRRFRAAPNGRTPDTKAMLRRALRRGGEIDRMALKTPRTRPPNLVAICDISGSMASYARMLMQFLHALQWAPNSGWNRVHGFTFGTRLTNVSRALALKDPDLALAALGRDAPDWKGGTRIGEALARFNRDWSRRVLGQGAVVLLITDGLERGDTDLLAHEAARLNRSCRKLIWLNPLLRFEGFAPEAAGIRALLPHVDSFHACHNLDSLADLGTALNGESSRSRFLEQMRAH